MRRCDDASLFYEVASTHSSMFCFSFQACNHKHVFVQEVAASFQEHLKTFYTQGGKSSEVKNEPTNRSKKEIGNKNDNYHKVNDWCSEPSFHCNISAASVPSASAPPACTLTTLPHCSTTSTQPLLA